MGTINHLAEYRNHLYNKSVQDTAQVKTSGSADLSTPFSRSLTSVENISAARTSAADGAGVFSGRTTAYKIFRMVFRGVGSVLVAPFKWGVWVYHQLRSNSEVMSLNTEQPNSQLVAKHVEAERKATGTMPVSQEGHSEVAAKTSHFPDAPTRKNAKLPRPTALNLPTPMAQALVLRRALSFEQIVTETRQLGSWNSQAGDIAIDWVVGKPALTDGRRVRILDRQGSAISLVPPQEEAPGGEDIYLMLDGGHYSPVKLTPDGRIGEIVPTPGDGNCFYRAVLSETSDGRVSPSQVSLSAIQEMRNHVADQIVNDRQNIEAFL